MTPEQFAYWLQGFAEIGSEPPTPEQWEDIKNHLSTVFVKITPEPVLYPQYTPIEPVYPDPMRPTIFC